MVFSQLKVLEEQGYVTQDGENTGVWKLSQEGILLSNQVFSALTYLKGEVPS